MFIASYWLLMVYVRTDHLQREDDGVVRESKAVWTPTSAGLSQFEYQDFRGLNINLVFLATVDNFLILEELGISGAISLVEPCGLNIPHLHPRANRVFHRCRWDPRHRGTVFPMGNIHYQQNPTCSPAVFFAALNNEDPGRSDIATSFWNLPSDVIDASLGFPETIGGGNIDAWRSHLPANLIAGVDGCLAACGLTA
ncbi:hypothetical protein DFH09DRAFT_1460861 [Mycena vulgaris]|nr:hypothetical protein DFH09DRAFT_1460861 [Mycena vulgaris]